MANGDNYQNKLDETILHITQYAFLLLKTRSIWIKKPFPFKKTFSLDWVHCAPNLYWHCS
ncbi:MAG: hypothetical protein ACD_80C00166G0008 [uncultured bacterium (gcode 4)]|uniref:Uncharacterized protein n=1 Tax=uncultured bacterium (gcode 4) TaxID=1234023 RepID=K1XI22_9BACT|nr:MAG: hypothetical protein ACD_80C00166G0008 [uncultured bacterium (gcode 4)]